MSSKAWVMRDLPIPASPTSSSTGPRRSGPRPSARAAAQVPGRVRPSGEAGSRCAPRAAVARSLSADREGGERQFHPFSGLSPRAIRSNEDWTSFCVLSAMTTCPAARGPAGGRRCWACRRPRRFLRRAMADQVAHDHQSGGDPGPRGKARAIAGPQLADRGDRGMAARTARSPLSSMRLRPAE